MRSSAEPQLLVLHALPARLEITSLQATLTVPPEPPSFGFISLWSGLDHVEAISADDNLLNQPLLPWGGLCARPSAPPYDSWLAEAFYYSTRPRFFIGR